MRSDPDPAKPGDPWARYVSLFRRRAICQSRGLHRGFAGLSSISARHPEKKLAVRSSLGPIRR